MFRGGAELRVWGGVCGVQGSGFRTLGLTVGLVDS